MHPAVDLILKRMKSNPEDFHYDPYGQKSTKWNSIISHYSQYFSEEENKAITKGYESVKESMRIKELDKCMESIYEAMAGTEESTEQEDVYKMKMKQRYTQPILEDGLSDIFKKEYNNASRS